MSIQPSALTMGRATGFAITEDMPIMLDYWQSSLEEKSIIGVRKGEDGQPERILMHSADEHTSPIQKMFKSENEYIIYTENSIYIVSNKIKSKRIE